MENWQRILNESITTSEDLYKHLGYTFSEIDEIIAKYPLRINPYFQSLIKTKGDPIWRQVVPDPLEMRDKVCIADPLGEESLSTVPNIVHKYPDRVLFLVNNSCAAYCRFCTRKRKVGTDRLCVTSKTITRGVDYIRSHPAIKEVLISGGDPLLLDDEVLEDILSKLRSIPTLEVIRIGSRITSTLPARITPKLVRILKQFHPLYINTHFNHLAEITTEAAKACGMLADAGIPLGCQTILLKGVNDNSSALKMLFRKLLQIRVRPYYLFQADLTLGTDHFRTPTSTGISIMRDLYGHLSGLAIPTLALDAPGGKGKIPLTPNYILSSDDNLVFENFRGEICTYPEAGEAV